MHLSYEQVFELLEDLALTNTGEVSALDERLLVRWEVGTQVLKLPLTAPPLKDEMNLSVAKYWEHCQNSTFEYWVILIRAGSASLGRYQEGELLAHKVIRKYMVRKKQGRAQLSYLNKKGKSRAGSRIRLREGVEFFEEINQKLSEWQKETSPNLIFVSCPTGLKSHWYSSRIAPPFVRDDFRLRAVPYHVHQPDHKELKRVNYLLSSGELVTES